MDPHTTYSHAVVIGSIILGLLVGALAVWRIERHEPVWSATASIEAGLRYIHEHYGNEEK